MLPQEKRKIDGHEYEVTAFGARQGYRLQAAIAKIAAPSVQDIIAAMPQEGLMEADMSVLGSAIGKLVAALVDSDPAGDLIVELLERTQRDGVPIDARQFDEIYAGNYAEMVKALAFVIEANRFFGMSGTGFLADILKAAR